MKSPRLQLAFWFGAIVVFGLMLWALAPVLLPFVVGMAIAYLLDPLVDWMERRGIGRAIGTSLIMAGAIIVLLVALVALFPLIRDQLVALGQALPDLIDRTQSAAGKLFEGVMSELSSGQRHALSTGIDEVGRSAVTIVGDLVSRLWSGGLVVVDFISIMLITPVVVFYLLRDWEKVIAAIDGWLPRDHVVTIREQARAVDKALAGFVRGQILVCAISGSLYALGWTVAGLNFGLIIGLIAGFLAFIPYVGGLVGLTLAITVGAGEYGLDWPRLGAILAVYLVVQGLEGTFIQPWLVGRSVGLHDLWIIFALLAGGALFGFLGVLLAVPAAAAIGVLVRFGLRRYLDSGFYKGAAGAGGDDGA